MKYIIIGLGNFGASLAQKLTEEGNEVIGIDRNMTKVDANKEKISLQMSLLSQDFL
jgi:trk system potassium uptake protein